MNLRRWWRRLWRRREVFVICERNVPVVVCEDAPTVTRELADRSRRLTRVYKVPQR